MIFLYVAVVTMAGSVPVGFFLGLRYAAARAVLRSPAPHEALARVYRPVALEPNGQLPGRP